MSDLIAYVDRMSWWSIGVAAIVTVCAMLFVLCVLDGLGNSRARYWGGR